MQLGGTSPCLFQGPIGLCAPAGARLKYLHDRDVSVAELAFLAIRVLKIDPVVLLHLRHDLWISQFVRGLNFDNMLRQRLGAAETLLEL